MKRSLRYPLILATALSFHSCETLSNITGDQIVTALTAVTELTGAVANWSSSQGDGDVSDGVLKQLSDYSEKAGGLGATLNLAIDALAPERKAQLAPIVTALDKLTGNNEAELKKLDQGQRREVVTKFSADAATLDKLIRAETEKS